jgi:hypothetical protein
MDQPKRRASGSTPGEESARELGQEANLPFDIPIEHNRKFRSPGLRRMRTDWNSEEGDILRHARDIAEKRITTEFVDAYKILSHIYDIVRIPILVDGQPPLPNGDVKYQKDAYGEYLEDWEKLTHREKDSLVYQITTRLFAWEQKAANIWQESMLAQVKWEEHYSISYDAPDSKTMGEREAIGRKEAIDDRYWAVIVTTYSRRADALVRSMERLAQRLERSMR